MLVIRFFRTGKKNQPFFKIVVTDKRKPTRAGRFVEEVGNWNPLTKERIINKERVKYWLSVGAKPSPSLHNLLISEKIIEAKKIPKHKKPKKKEGDKVAVEPAKPAAELEKKPASVKTSASDKSTADKSADKEATAGKPASAKASAGKEEKTEGEKGKETTQKPAETK